MSSLELVVIATEIVDLYIQLNIEFCNLDQNVNSNGKSEVSIQGDPAGVESAGNEIKNLGTPSSVEICTKIDSSINTDELKEPFFIDWQAAAKECVCIF